MVAKTGQPGMARRITPAGQNPQDKRRTWFEIELVGEIEATLRLSDPKGIGPDRLKKVSGGQLVAEEGYLLSPRFLLKIA